MISPERNRVTILTLTVFLAASASPQAPPPYTWRAVEQTTRNGTVRLLTTTSTGAYIAADGSPQHAALEIKCSAPLTGSATISAGSGDSFAVKTEATTTLPIRLDDDPVIHAAWANLSLHQILIYDLRDLLPPHQRLTVDLPFATAGSQRLSFDLSQLTSAMRDFNCRRRLR